ncbi:MAG TPA: hypothetical protein VK808_01070 [Bacteroidia bacterium]|jgi:hypothetical protein|nr:hypothetical protein [Bacteroidia bacterium]
MEITINDERKIFAVQKEFSDMFPFLKLEFFSKSNKGGGAPSSKLMKHISKTIAECRTIHSAGHIKIRPQMTVGEVEQNFRDVFGLSVQVFRKYADNWMQITNTENLSLEKQNVEGAVVEL